MSDTANLNPIVTGIFVIVIVYLACKALGISFELRRHKHHDK